MPSNNEKLDDHYFNVKEEGFSLREIFLSFLLLYIILFTWFILNDYEKNFSTAKENGIKTSKIASLQVHSTFQQIRNVLIVLSSELADKNLHRLKKDGYNNYLNSRSMLIPDIETLILIDINGKILENTNASTSKENFKDKVYFKSLKETNSDNLLYSEKEHSIISNEWVTSFSHRMYDEKNNFDGLITAQVPMSLWYNYFHQQKIEDADEINIIDLKNCAILGTTSKVNNEYQSKYIDRNFCNNFKEKFSSKADQNKNMISSVLLPDFKVAIVTITANSSIMGPFYSKSFTTILISLIIIGGYWLLIRHQLKIENGLKEKKIQMINNSKMATLGEMASGIAHEINNPLTIIKGRLQQVIRLIKKGDTLDIEQLEKSIATTLLATDRINNIVAGMKSISRENQLDINEEIPLQNIFNNTMIFCQEKLANINVQLTIDPIPTGLISCKETQISQVILNLINNSSDAIELLEEKWLKINFVLLENNKFIKIIFTDSGPGIPPEVLAKIMIPFFTTKPIGKGTGLGLSISTRIIKEHGGELSYNPESPNTQFTITLPFIKTA